MGSADYDFRTVWRVAGTPKEVADVLGDARALPRWWPAVYLGVDPAAGSPDATGTDLPRPVALHTKGWLPYTLRWTLTITEPVTAHGFALTAVGDLNGTGRWTFEQDGPETVITYDWHVRAAKPLLRRLSWLLKPVFAANHHWAMARGEESLALELRRRRHRTTRRHQCLSSGWPYRTGKANEYLPDFPQIDTETVSKASNGTDAMTGLLESGHISVAVESRDATCYQSAGSATAPAACRRYCTLPATRVHKDHVEQDLGPEEADRAEERGAS